MVYTRIRNRAWLAPAAADLCGPGFPLPEGSFLGRRAKAGFAPQLSLGAPAELIWEHSETYGYISDIRRDGAQLRTRPPFTLQVVTRLDFRGSEEDAYAAVYIKIAPHSADYAFQRPVASPDTLLIIRAGDPVTGILTPNQSIEKAGQLIKARSAPTWQERNAPPGTSGWRAAKSA